MVVHNDICGTARMWYKPRGGFRHGWIQGPKRTSVKLSPLPLLLGPLSRYYPRINTSREQRVSLTDNSSRQAPWHCVQWPFLNWLLSKGHSYPPSGQAHIVSLSLWIELGAGVNPIILWDGFPWERRGSIARRARSHVHLHSISGTVNLTVDKPSQVVEKTLMLLISFLPLMKKDQ